MDPAVVVVVDPAVVVVVGSAVVVVVGPAVVVAGSTVGSASTAASSSPSK